MPAVRRLSSAEKLTRMYELFTKHDNRKLNTGEVDALAGFYGGLSKSSQAKVKGQLVDIFRKAEYLSGQKERFLQKLTQVGFTRDELEGVSADSVAGFLKLSKGSQLDKLLELASLYGDGETREVKPNKLSPTTRDAINTELSREEQSIRRRYRKDPDLEIGEYQWQAVYGEERNGRRELYGYAVRMPIYAEEHDVDRAYYFNVRGDYLGDEYVGE